MRLGNYRDILPRDAYRLHFVAFQLLVVSGGAIKRIVI